MPTNPEIVKIRYHANKKNGVCVKCQKRKAVIGLIRCKSCNNKANKISRENKTKVHLKNVDKLIDNGLITTRQSAEILNIHVNKMLFLMHYGVIKSKAYAPEICSKTYWFSELEVMKLKKKLVVITRNNRKRNVKGQYAKEIYFNP